ncbi:hypothetical protein BH20ACI3_BH20ACI3_41940 [soil metagenome]
MSDRQTEILNMKDDERVVLEQRLRQLARHHGMTLSYPGYLLLDSDTTEVVEQEHMSLFEVEAYLNELGWGNAEGSGSPENN